MYNEKINHLLLCCCFVLILGSCKAPMTPADPTTLEELYPLAYGNYWVYDEKILNADGTIQSQSAKTIEITGTQSIHGYNGFIQDADGTPEVLYFSGSDLKSSQSDTAFQLIMLHYPMNAGEVRSTLDTTLVISFDTSRIENITQKQQLTFFSANEQVTVPAGTFSCHHFENRSITIYQYGFYNSHDTTWTHLYFAPGVGLIKEITYASDSGKTYAIAADELTTYRVEKN